MDQIKESFSKVKQDIDSLKGELEFLRNGVIETRNQMVEVCGALIKLNERIQDINQKNQITQEIVNNLHMELTKTHIKTPIPTQNPEYPTYNQQNPLVPTHNPTDNSLFKPLNTQNKLISIGNGGVPTDRQTDRQTDNPIVQQTQISLKTPGNSVDNALEILESLDIIKKEIRLKFKKLTDQEWVIFSTIYQLEEELGYADYRTLAERLKLTESSIRDYAGRLMKKGIPVEKNKINNKAIHLSISPNLKKIATLPTIMQLRDL